MAQFEMEVGCHGADGFFRSFRSLREPGCEAGLSHMEKSPVLVGTEQRTKPSRTESISSHQTPVSLSFFHMRFPWDAKQDPLIEINAVVPWDAFRPLLERVWRKPDPLLTINFVSGGIDQPRQGNPLGGMAMFAHRPPGMVPPRPLTYAGGRSAAFR